jgi:hypothetical protein
MGPAVPKTKNRCDGKGEQEFADQTKPEQDCCQWLVVCQQLQKRGATENESSKGDA